MSYQVLALKYRPQSFDDVVAQDHVTKTLRNSLTNNRIGSGYLFCGPRGTGKTTTARILAKALNCVNGPTATPCGECPNCKEITAGSSLDVLEIDAASNTGVDDVRTLRENVRYMPTSGKKRIYIIDEVHRLSGAAFDALLKTLEEPPPHVLFVFATTEPLKVPETILSRTQRFDFKRVSVVDLAGNLKRIAEAEGIEISEDALRLLARKADGSVRDSLSLMDQIAAFAGTRISEQDVIEGLGLVHKQFLVDFTTAIAGKDSKQILRLVKDLIDGGVDVADFVTELLEHFRIMLVLAADEGSGELLSLADDELQGYKEQATYFSVGDLLRLIKMGADLNLELKSGLSERLVLEMTAVKMAQMEATVVFQEVIERLSNQPASGVGANGSPDLFPTTEKKKCDPTTSPAPSERGDKLTFVRKQTEDQGIPAAEPFSATRSLNVPILKKGWQGYLRSLRQTSPMLASQMGMTEIREVSDNKILFAFAASEQIPKQLVEKPENLKLITTTMREHYGANLSIRFTVDEAREKPSETDKKPNGNGVDVTNLVENSPRLKMILEKVNGEIIGVKKTK